MNIKEWWGKRRNDIVAILLLVLYFSAMIGLALIVKHCVPDGKHYEEYDEYLEEYYDNLERYDPV